jgi:hypothetical protein
MLIQPTACTVQLSTGHSGSQLCTKQQLAPKELKAKVGRGDALSAVIVPWDCETKKLYGNDNSLKYGSLQYKLYCSIYKTVLHNRPRPNEHLARRELATGIHKEAATSRPTHTQEGDWAKSHLTQKA